MRMLIAAVLGCALVIGLNHAASSGATERGARSSYERASPAAEQVIENAAEDLQLENESAYQCPPYTPYCQRASQCTDYCAGGVPVCFQGCCSCAS
jgi:hypothetical protein